MIERRRRAARWNARGAAPAASSPRARRHQPARGRSRGAPCARQLNHHTCAIMRRFNRVFIRIHAGCSLGCEGSGSLTIEEFPAGVPMPATSAAPRPTRGHSVGVHGYAGSAVTRARKGSTPPLTPRSATCLGRSPESVSVVVSGSDQGAGRALFPCVAQAGRAPRSGRGGRRFESVHTDHTNAARRWCPPPHPRPIPRLLAGARPSTPPLTLTARALWTLGPSEGEGEGEGEGQGEGIAASRRLMPRGASG